MPATAAPAAKYGLTPHHRLDHSSRCSWVDPSRAIPCSAIDLALWRLARDKTIRRLTQGVYDYPRIHKKLGVLSPNPDHVAAALASRTGSRIQISGQRAANLLGLSQQVPAQLIYLTDGPPQKITIGSQVITLKPARPSETVAYRQRASAISGTHARQADKIPRLMVPCRFNG